MRHTAADQRYGRTLARLLPWRFHLAAKHAAGTVPKGQLPPAVVAWGQRLPPKTVADDPIHPATDWGGEARYNSADMTARSCVKRSNGVLKAHFRYSERFVCIIQMNGKNLPINKVEVQITPTIATFGIAMQPSHLLLVTWVKYPLLELLEMRYWNPGCRANSEICDLFQRQVRPQICRKNINRADYVFFF